MKSISVDINVCEIVAFMRSRVVAGILASLRAERVVFGIEWI
jgi:hypothetical protein